MALYFLKLASIAALTATIAGNLSAAENALVGRAGRVVIGEINNPVTSVNSTWIGYFVDVLDPSVGVAAFAVSSGYSYGGATTIFPGWAAATVYSPSAWDAGYTFSIGGATTVTTSALGTAASIFGDDSRIAIYWLSTGDNIIFDDGTNATDVDQADWSNATPQFRITIPIRSEFIALDINGQIIDASHSAIPEPASVVFIAWTSMLVCMSRRCR